MKFDDFVISRLTKAGAYFAIDINRPKVKMILNEGNFQVKKAIKEGLF